MAQSSIKNLKSGSHIHMMGICGTAMASLAGLLKDRGFKVSGSDSNPYPPMSTQVESLGIQIAKPYKKENLNPKPDFVVIGNVISANNEEAQEVVRLGLPYCSLPQAMGDVIIDHRDSFVISGTHGKTTTTSLMSWVAETCGHKPGFLIGGIPKNFAQSFKNPAGNVFVIEGDEYDTAYFDKVPKFIHYKPKFVILTSVEFDHADIYPDFDAVKSAFRRLVDLVPANGTLVYWADDENVVALASKAKTDRRLSYGFADSADFKIKDMVLKNTLTYFDVIHKGQKLGSFVTEMTGRYNILNATAVIAQAYLQGWPLEKVTEALRTFSGVKRRQENLGEFRGVTLIEDFAHHPTAVKETVKAIQNKYEGRKVFSIFEPRSATSRRKVFQNDYVQAFKEAHDVLIAKAFDQGKIDESDRFSSEDLVEDLVRLGKKAQVHANVESIIQYIVREAQPTDVVLIMSNGGFDGIYTKLIDRLKG